MGEMAEALNDDTLDEEKSAPWHEPHVEEIKMVKEKKSPKPKAKKPTKKPAKAKTKKSFEMNARQKKVFDFIKAKGPIAIDTIARTVFARERPLAKANSWTRNQLRDLRKQGLVKKVSRGTYAVTKA